MAKFTIDIPVNSYQTPTKINPKAVEAICKAFIGKDADRETWRGEYTVKHDDIIVIDTIGNYHFDDTVDKIWAREKGSEVIEFHGVDMNAAIEALTEAKWHVFKRTEYPMFKKGHRTMYTVSKYDFKDGWEEVRRFDDRID